MLKAIKVRLYLNKDQVDYTNKLLGTSRFVYNNLLAFKIEEYNINKHSVTFGELGKKLVDLKSEFEWVKDSHSKVLQQSLIDLEKAYKSFFKNGAGFPKFKSKKDNKSSCRFPSDAFSGVKGNRLSLIKQLKDIHFKCSKSDEKFLNKNQSGIRSATLSKTKTGKYYLSILVDKPNKVLDTNSNSIGLDLGIKDFIVDSNGKSYENLKLKRNNEEKLAKLHRNLSRKVKGSKNREKSRVKLAKFYEKLNNVKENYLHQVVNQILNENQVVIIEDLNIKGILKNHNLARSTQELSLYRFKEILRYKASWLGRDLIEIDRFYPSSKLCYDCCFKNNDLTLKDREWKCPNCHKIHLRDLNAALNIKREGLRIFKTK
jgi:putative transposase